MERRPGALTLSEDDRRVVAVWAAVCAERTVALFEVVAPGDTRPREAIEGVRAFAHGELGIGAVRVLSAEAHAAARAVQEPAAVAAARAAGHTAAGAHMASHALGAPAYGARAAGFAAPGDPTAVAGVLDWAQSRASPRVRDVLRRLPSRTASVGALGSLVVELESRLTGGG